MTNIKERRPAVKRRIVAILVAIAMVFSMAPFSGDSAKASSSMIKNMKAAGAKIVRKNGKKCCAFSIKADFSGDSVEEAKGLVHSFVDEIYESVVQDQSMYAATVWKEIQDSYSKINNAVDNTKRVKDLFVSDGFEMYLNEELAKELEIMTTLGYMIKHYIKDNKDLPKLVKKAKKKLNEVKEDAEKKYFNYFYWGRLQNLLKDAYGDLKKVKSLRGYVLAISGINEWYEDVTTSIILADEEIDYPYEEDEDDYSQYEPGELLIPIEEAEYEEIIMIIIGGEYEGYVKNKNEVEEARWLQVSRLKEFVQRSGKKTKKEKEKAEKAIDKFKKNTLNNIEDTDKIEEAGGKKIEEMMSKAGVKIQEVTRREFVDTARQYNALTSEYNQLDYHEGKWGLVERAFFETKDIIENAEYNYEFYGLIPYLKARADKVITLKKQFAKERKRIRKELKAYTKKGARKKFNQKKIKKLIRQFDAKVKKIKDYDIDKLLELEEKYNDKAEECINRYKITVKKKGKGYAGKSKKVKYGESHTVKLKPAKGYKIKKVTIDGKKKKAKRKYTFKKVRKNHVVKVVFGKKHKKNK